jgi:hypothetical protein
MREKTGPPVSKPHTEIKNSPYSRMVKKMISADRKFRKTSSSIEESILKSLSVEDQ